MLFQKENFFFFFFFFFYNLKILFLINIILKKILLKIPQQKF